MLANIQKYFVSMSKRAYETVINIADSRLLQNHTKFMRQEKVVLSKQECFKSYLFNITFSTKGLRYNTKQKMG